MACDRWAIAVSEVEPCAYAGALIKVVKEMRHVSHAQEGLSLVRGMRSLEDRLQDVLQDDVKKSPQLSPTVKVVLVCWSLFVLARGSRAGTIKETSTSLPSQNEISFQRAPAPEKERRPTRLRRTGEQQVGPSKQMDHPLVNQVPADAGQARSDQTAPLASQTLSPYEEGYRLGSGYAQERARSQTQPTTEEEMPAEEKSKREIEMRLQRLTRHPPQQ